MKGHGHVKAVLLDYLSAWVPIRLEMYRVIDGLDGPPDPAAYLAMDTLPQNDPSLYPCVVVMSTSTVPGGIRRRQAGSAGDAQVFDVDYDVTLVVAVENSEFADDLTVAAWRDQLMLAVRECLILPGRLDDVTEILQNPPPDETTGAAVQTVRGDAAEDRAHGIGVSRHHHDLDG